MPTTPNTKSFSIAELISEAVKVVPESDAQWLLSYYLSCGLSELRLREREMISAKTAANFRAAVSERVSGRPLQYIVGSVDFYNVELSVSEVVLIPRPETEELVELVLTEVPPNLQRNFLDIGTGSGAIALALKKEVPIAEVGASDVSESALEVAKANATRNRLAVEFRSGYLLAPWKSLRPDTIVISNLPYVGKHDVGLASDVRRWEPELALIPQQKGRSDLPYDGAWLVDELFIEIEELAVKPKRVYLELSPEVIRVICEKWKALWREARYRVISDCAGKDRFLIVEY